MRISHIPTLQRIESPTSPSLSRLKIHLSGWLRSSGLRMPDTVLRAPKDLCCSAKEASLS